MVGFNMGQLKHAGFTPREIKNRGHKVSEVFSLEELKQGGFSLRELKADEGFALRDLLKVFTVDELKRFGGYLPADLLREGLKMSDLREGGLCVPHARSPAQHTQTALSQRSRTHTTAQRACIPPDGPTSSH